MYPKRERERGEKESEYEYLYEMFICRSLGPFRRIDMQHITGKIHIRGQRMCFNIE